MKQIQKRAFFLKTLSDWGFRNGFSVQKLSGDWVVLLTRGDLTLPVISYDIGLNSSSVHRIVNDKVATYEILNLADVPALEHRIFVHPDRGGLDVLDRLKLAFIDFGEDAVIKPTDQSHGLDVFRVQSMQELEAKFAEFLTRYQRFCLSPFVRIIQEDRFYFLDDAELLSYGKRAVDGDFRVNLAAGAEVVVHDGQEQQSREIAKAAWDVTGLRFGCIDVVTLASGRRLVMEANSGVMLDEIARWAAREGVDMNLREVYEKGFEALLRSRLQAPGSE